MKIKQNEKLKSCDIIEGHGINSEGKNITKRYNKGRFLGKGAFANCYEVTDLESNKTYAAKVISKESFNKFQVKQKVCNFNKYS